jgi:hypothetical protein
VRWLEERFAERRGDTEGKEATGKETGVTTPVANAEAVQTGGVLEPVAGAAARVATTTTRISTTTTR